MSNRAANRDEQIRRLAETMRRQLGAQICDRMTDPSVVEIMLNADGCVWEDRLASSSSATPTCSIKSSSPARRARNN